MPVAWYLNRWLYWCMSEDEKKELDPMFIEELQKCVSVAYKLGVLRHFASWCTESYFELYQVFMLNLFKYFDRKNQTIFIRKCFNTLRPKYDLGHKIFYPGGKMFQYPQLVYYEVMNIFIFTYFFMRFTFAFCCKRIKTTETIKVTVMFRPYSS